MSDIKPDWDFGRDDLLEVLENSSEDVAVVSRHGMVI